MTSNTPRALTWLQQRNARKARETAENAKLAQALERADDARMARELGPIFREHGECIVGSFDAAVTQRQREQDLIRRDQVAAGQETARKAALADQRKQRGETSLAWQMRLARSADLDARTLGPIVTAEAEQHDAYADATVDHFAEDGTRTRAVTKVRRVESALTTMRDKGTITEAQWRAAGELALVGEIFRRAVDPGCNSLEARVDRSRVGDGELVERMGAVRLSMAYTRWRMWLPAPKLMVLNMIRSDQNLAAVGRAHGKTWTTARKLLLGALDRWDVIKDQVWREIEEPEIEAVYHKLGTGRLA